MGKAMALRAMRDEVVRSEAGKLVQAGALVWRPAVYTGASATRSASGIEVLLITSLRTGRWVIPKGWPKAGQSLAGSALDEAWEEAGVHGRVGAKALGEFDYIKPDRRKERDFTVAVYEIALSGLDNAYPERHRRRRLWIAPEKAADLVDEPGLSALLRAFKPRLRAS
jgi:8-oxo-dGTP pyrophosphatase MutT (NUDIX family)